MKNDGGFALLALMVALASGGLMLVAALSRVDAPGDDRARRAQAGVESIAAAAEFELLRNGAFPATLSVLAAMPEHAEGTGWAVDPYGGGSPYRYQLTSGGRDLSVMSRGPDGQLDAGGDDVEATRSVQVAGRARTRDRLRLLRGAFLRSPYMTSTAMSVSDRVRMRDAVRDYSGAQRSFWTADAATRSALSVSRAAARTTILDLRGIYSLPSPPAAVAGASGLIELLGLSVDWERDGFGQTFVADDAVGARSIAGDGVGGTDDDL